MTTKTTQPATRRSRLPSPAPERRIGDSGVLQRCRGLGGRLRFTCAAPRPRAGHPAAAATAAPRARGAARRRGRRRAAVLAAAPGTCFALAASSVGAQVGTPRVGVGVIPCPRRRWRSAATLDFAGCAAPALAPGAEPPVPAPRRRGRPGSLRSWGCASWASPASRCTGRPGAARSIPAPRPLLARHPDPSIPTPSPTPELSRKKTPCTHLGMDARLSHRLAKLLEDVHWSVGRFGHGVRAAFLLFNNVGSARSAARVVGHVGTAAAGCCQDQGFLRILKL